ncbi:hypothetical protein BS50DRAFT_622529 [Corynespora cassiicola Philippines]|uniref:Rhodopsin domain-containing protein n=1 Tax=Corynespora cassiicola Philippines TaxID=1448308 RepID=A0A2T2NJP9_CORCC|nr:hypothetical protein BS50DRAFT_622529 [Corynespora cassiicola Philippines]
MSSTYASPPVPTALATVISFLSLDCLCVVARFYSRIRPRQSLGADDWLLIPSLFCVGGLAAIFLYGVEAEYLAHSFLPPPNERTDYETYDLEAAMAARADRLSSARRLYFSTLVLHVPTNGLIKLSLLSLYRRVFVYIRVWKDLRNLFFIVIIVLVALWMTIFIVLSGVTIAVDGQRYLHEGACVSGECPLAANLAYAYAISTIVTDLVILAIPLPFVWRLQLSTHKRIAVCGIFLLGSVASVASVIRYLVSYVMKPREYDEELWVTASTYWLLLEVEIGLLAACLPTLRGLRKSEKVSSLLTRLRISRSRKKKYPSPYRWDTPESSV